MSHTYFKHTPSPISEDAVEEWASEFCPGHPVIDHHFPDPQGQYYVVVKPDSDHPSGPIVVSVMCACGADDCAWQWTAYDAASSKNLPLTRPQP